MYADLHVHLRGTLSPLLAKKLASGKGSEVSNRYIDKANRYIWSDFSGFLETYDAIAGLIKDGSDLEQVAYEYLAAAAADGCVYVEFMLSPPDLLREGVSYSDQLKALESSWQRSKADFGIESRLIATAVRHLGPDAALEAARIVGYESHPYVVGFGLTGDERKFDAKDFKPAFEFAKKNGLRLTAHAGEHREASTIKDAVDFLELDRVGHGVRAAESAPIAEFLQERQVGLEICISSNLALGLFPSLYQHPFAWLRDRGVKLCLGTDDPAFFNTSCATEYALAAENAALDNIDLVALTMDAIGMSFCQEETKRTLLNTIAGMAHD
ncbi:adenosine deaminase [Bradyrhizobium sp. GM0.4]